MKTKAKAVKPKRIVKKYAKGGKITDWKTKALRELRKISGEKDLQKAHYDISFISDDNGFNVAGSQEFMVFKTYDDAERYATEYVKKMLDSEPENFTPDWLSQHVYVSDTDKRIIASEEGDNYADDIANDEPERIIDEAGIYDSSEWEQLEDEDEKQKQLDESIEKVKETIYDNWYEGLDKDPIDFLVNEQGLYSQDDIKNLSFIQIDTNAAAEDAVNTDGVAHFLSGYDGNEISLSGGVVAYRTN